MHEAHAIERVRVMFQFKEPLPSKLLSSATLDVVEHAKDYGYNSVTPAESGMTKIEIRPDATRTTHEPTKKGVVLQRHVDEKVAEEVGFRDTAFGYVTTVYGRWENLMGRLDTVVLPALRKASEAIEFNSVRLEYWDVFRFDGSPDKADITELLERFDDSVPQEALAGENSWHSHIGWFEGDENSPLLINRNLDALDRTRDDEIQRVLGIYTLVERRIGKQPLDVDQIPDILKLMHRRSIVLFGETLTKKYRAMIGIDLSEYQ